MNRIHQPTVWTRKSYFIPYQRRIPTCPARFSTQAKPDETQIQAIMDEAHALTTMLYRSCVRSIRLIRHGNEIDEADFQEREEEQFQAENNLRGSSMISMLPPVDREDELRSRAEYYLQYARENFVQESNSLTERLGRNNLWQEQQIGRFVHQLKRGEKHRQWLLQDMGFDDPYVGIDLERIEGFEQEALALIRGGSSNDRRTQAVEEDADEDDLDWSDDEDDEQDVRSAPSWLRRGN